MPFNLTSENMVFLPSLFFFLLWSLNFYLEFQKGYCSHFSVICLPGQNNFPKKDKSGSLKKNAVINVLFFTDILEHREISEVFFFFFYPLTDWLLNLDKESMTATYSKFQLLGCILPRSYYWPVLNSFVCITEVSSQCPDTVVYKYTTLRW